MKDSKNFIRNKQRKDKTMVVIKFNDGTYYAGCRNPNAKTLLGEQIYKSKKTAENIISKSINFHSDKNNYSIVEVKLKEKE